MKRNKLTTAIPLILLMATTFLAFINMPVNAQDEIQVKTTAYLSFRPNPVGVGQTFLVNIWITPATHYERHISGYKVTITKPSGAQEVVTMDSYQGDATAWFEWLADEVGEWKLKFDFPGEHLPELDVPASMFSAAGTLSPAYYMPSSTAEETLIVQEEMVYSWPPAPLPTDYWTRPVTPENREWMTILGDYPYTGFMANPPSNTNAYASNYRFTPYVQGPNTAHVVWKRLGALSGIMGGDMTQLTYGWGEGTYAGAPSVIFEGRAYQSITAAGGEDVLQCYDIRTGELYWEIPNPIPGSQGFFGYTPGSFTAISYNAGMEAVPGASHSQVGTGASLVSLSGGYLRKYDPYTASLTLEVPIAPLTTGTIYSDPYVLSVQNLGPGNYRLIKWTIAGSTPDLASRVLNNVTWPFSSLGAVDYETGIAVSASPITPEGLGAWYGSTIMAANIETGDLLWTITDSDTIYSTSTGVADHGKFAICMMDRHWNCYNLLDGSKEWESELTDYPWGWAWGYTVASAYGQIYGLAYDGVYAFDWDDGHISWKFSAGDAGYETPYGTWSWMGYPQIADGKVYAGNGEHSPTAPLTRGWKLYCIDALTGDGIWNITGGMTAGAIADGYLTADNRYDGYMYVFGKGQSETTVVAPLGNVANGLPMTITGAVLDISPAQPETPCVSKESMTTQMNYIHMQHPIDGLYHDEIITGVPVTLTAIGEDGTYVDIGTTTTDGYSGTFGASWTPTAEGTYKIIAAFAGDDSYGSSSATTWITVGPAISSTTLIEPEQPTSENQLISTELAIVIAVIAACIIGAVAYIVLKKRK